MALIKCPECGKNVSTTAAACPECGFGICDWYRDNAVDLDSQKNVVYKGKTYTVGDLNREALNVDQKNNNYFEAKEKWLFLLDIQAENSYVKKYTANNMGYYYLKDIEYDVEKAIEYLSIAARMSEPQAESLLGNIYNPMFTDSGNGGSKHVNIDKAIAWYRKAAQHGHIYAMNNLGVLYGDKKNSYLLAAFYCWVAFKNGNKKAEDNFIIYSKQIPYEYINIIQKYSSINDEQSFVKHIEQHENNKPKCPNCKSTNICSISGTRRWLSTGLLGIGSPDIGKSMRCKECGYRW